MSSFSTSRFACHECSGEGSVDCCSCEQEVECDHCEGTGLDPDVIDLDLWRAAEEKLKTNERGAFVSTWAWIEGGEWVGRCHRGAGIRYEDYLIKESES